MEKDLSTLRVKWAVVPSSRPPELFTHRTGLNYNKGCLQVAGFVEIRHELALVTAGNEALV